VVINQINESSKQGEIGSTIFIAGYTYLVEDAADCQWRNKKPTNYTAG